MTTNYEFKIGKGVDIPPPEPSRQTHPFPWDKLQPGNHFDVPRSYWTEHRGMPVGTYTATKARERIRNHFRGWQEKDTTKRGKLGITMRTMDDGGFVRVWLVNQD